MAEIEPTGGPSAEPVQTQPVSTTPPAGVPGEGAGTPTAGPPSRPGGLVRWGIALLTLAVTVGVVSVAVALLAAGAGTSSVEKWLPGDTVAYLEVRADLPGDQRAKVGNILAKFPGFADQASLDAKIDEALERVLEGAGVSWTSDVKPWLGGEVGIAVTSAAFDVASLGGLGANGLDGADLGKAPDDGAAILVAVKDAGAAKAWVAKQIGGSQATETYAGGEITIVAGLLRNNLAFAVRDNVLILGPEATVKAALDTNGSSAIGTSESFAAARKTAPSAYLGYGYVDVQAFVDAALGAANDQADVPAACLDGVLSMVPAWAAGSARAIDDAIVFEATSPAADGGAATASGSASSIASRLPGTTVAAVEVRDFGPGLVAGLDMLKQQLACDPSTAEAIQQIDQVLAAVGGADALVGWAGDTALAVDFAGGTVGGGLAATVDDEAAAGRALDQLQALLAFGGAGSGLATREETYGSGTLLVLDVSTDSLGADVPELAVTLQDGVFVLGTLDFVKATVDTSASTSLAGTDTYKRAISAAGGDGVSDVFVDIAGLRAAAETMIPAAEKTAYETEVKPFLEPFQAFASVAEAPGATTVSRAVITFTK